MDPCYSIIYAASAPREHQGGEGGGSKKKIKVECARLFLLQRGRLKLAIGKLTSHTQALTLVPAQPAAESELQECLCGSATPQ